MDGHKPPAARALAQTLKQLEESKQEVTIANILCAGFPKTMVADLLILKFPAPLVPWPYFRPALLSNCPKCNAGYPDQFLAHACTDPNKAALEILRKNLKGL
jgi:hypothetical protein